MYLKYKLWMFDDRQTDRHFSMIIITITIFYIFFGMRFAKEPNQRNQRANETKENLANEAAFKKQKQFFTSSKSKYLILFKSKMDMNYQSFYLLPFQLNNIYIFKYEISFLIFQSPNIFIIFEYRNQFQS